MKAFILITLVFTLLSHLCSFAAPGDLDPSFGNGGKVVTPIGNYSDYVTSIALDGDQRILVAGHFQNTGEVPNGGNTAFALVRYGTGGTPDNTFGQNGRVLTAIGRYENQPFSVVPQADGKIVVGGSFRSDVGASSALAIVRYRSDGSLDTDFGSTAEGFTGNGKIINPTMVSAAGVALQTDGKIIAAGSYFNGITYDFAASRYHGNGTFDTAFGYQGTVVDGLFEYDGAGLVKVQSDGKFLLGGPASTNGRYGFSIRRFNSNGTLDFSFGSGGRVTTAFPGGDAFPRGMLIQADGKVVLAGYANNGTNNDIVLVRYNTDGTLDSTFGGSGKVTIDVSSNHDYANSVALQGNGKILVTGYSLVGNQAILTLLRFNVDGTSDSGFGSNGKVLTPVANSDFEGIEAVVQNDGKIVIGATLTNLSNLNRDFAVLRYEAGPFSPLEQWKLSQLNNVNAPNLADWDKDGLVHLAEYALNLSPLAASPPLPVERHTYSEGERLRMFFIRDPARNDVTIEVQAAARLEGPWTTVAVSMLAGLTTGPGYVGGDNANPGLKTVEVRDTVNISADVSRYLRVKVTH